MRKGRGRFKKYLLTMRFALRRQDKIKAHFVTQRGRNVEPDKREFNRFFAADRSEFPEGLRDIEDDFNHYPGDPYPTIAVNDVGDPDRMIEFFLCYHFTIWHLKGFIKG